ncbi:hypothetical protein DACRYDRAFT_99454 [Dacryopinax primogenitus]|uniref:type I protein arginine methyltransferase n=1 Tax=Dacryopinax primogenitus (strain DJM 731) TaxID=1858805 RepID=M5G2X4_DACPD|nr:uncharacterized protein DACRYDRAFT_99454 [Dacryopinax primogenitus]EJU03049.1 hypothetical protein DACRYDRAFT_99454 [Dacryopinax primogenitus]
MSLFGPNKLFGSLREALSDAKGNYGVDSGEICDRLELDFYDRMRLVNFLRKERPPPDIVNTMTGHEPFFKDDVFLIPVIPDDPLLQAHQETPWSDDEDSAPGLAALASRSSQPVDLSRELRRANRTIRSLQQQLGQAKQDLVDYKGIVNKALGVNDVKQWVEMKAGGDGDAVLHREDPQYFDAYEDIADDDNLMI